MSRFLTSNPDEDDVTTALDEVLADWSAPVLTGLSLEVNRAGAEAAGRTVALITPGPQSAVDVGDLPAGRPVWVIGRVPTNGESLSFRLRTGAEVVAEQRVDVKNATPGLKALFGADRVRRLEYVMNANYSGEDLRAELARLGTIFPPLAEGVHGALAKTRDAQRELLVKDRWRRVCRVQRRHSSRCSETGQVRKRESSRTLPQDGRRVSRVAGSVANAIGACFSAPAAADTGVADSMLADFDDDDSNTTTLAHGAPRKSAAARRAAIRVEPNKSVNSARGRASLALRVRPRAAAVRRATSAFPLPQGSTRLPMARCCRLRERWSGAVHVPVSCVCR